jgi:hypothetical protein
MSRTELTVSDIFDLVNLVGRINPKTLTIEEDGRNVEEPREWTLAIIHKCRDALYQASLRPKGNVHLLFPFEEES